MTKHKIDTKPITRMSLYLISTAEIYAVFAVIGGVVWLGLLLAAGIKIVLGQMPAYGMGSVALGGLAICGMLLLIGLVVVQTRTRPPYRYYKRRWIDFPACLKEKALSCTDGEHYVYWDDRWFVAAMPMGASALCADVIDFSVPATVKVLSGGRGSAAFRFYFRTDDGKQISIRLARRIKPFKNWVRSQGGTIK